MLLLLLAQLLFQREADQTTLINQGPAALVGVLMADQSRARLAPGDSLQVPSPGEPFAARFALEEWGIALAELGPERAETHLRSAGQLLDALSPGAPGFPEEALNRQRLRETPPELLQAWMGAPALRLALLASAARFCDPNLLEMLLDQISPQEISPTWPPGYESLLSLPELLREAIEAQGSHALPLLYERPDWARDRGLLSPLKAPLSQLREALREARWREAARIALQLSPKGVEAGRLKRAALDRYAQLCLARGQHLAAQQALEAAAPYAELRLSFRERLAQLYRARGDKAFRAADLGSAMEWYSGALFMARLPLDRARLVETLAGLARLQLATERYPQGNILLKEAIALAPEHPAVLALQEAHPSPGLKVRVAIMFICLGLALASWRRLRRVFRR